MKILNVKQGSPEWLDARAGCFTASEAPAMMGAGYISRSELIRQKASGIQRDVDPATQTLFDRGHRTEAMARPIIEAIIGEELYPATGVEEVDGMRLLASFDGITMDETTGFEHKLFNADLFAKVQGEEIPPKYYWQLEHQALVGCLKRILFVVSDGTEGKMAQCWYYPQPERQQQLIAGWKQFQADLAEYQPVEASIAPVGSAVESMTALVVQVEGRVIASNLDAFKANALEFIGRIKTDLQTDQDFADAEKVVKACKESEDKLAAAKEQVLAQTADIDAVFRVIDQISEELRGKRLHLDKTIKAKKESRRDEIVSAAKAKLAGFIAEQNARIGGKWMPAIDGRFAEAVKGKKTLSSTQDAVDTALAAAKVTASTLADQIAQNRSTLSGSEHDYMFLFPDFASVCTKNTEDFANLLATRIAANERAENERRERQAQQAQQAKPVPMPTRQMRLRSEWIVEITDKAALLRHIAETPELLRLVSIDIAPLHDEIESSGGEIAFPGVRARKQESA